MTKLQQLDKAIGIVKETIRIQEELKLQEAESRGYKKGFEAANRQAIQYHCPHNAEDRESVSNEDEVWSICTACEKDFTPSFLDDMDTKYVSDGQLPF